MRQGEATITSPYPDITGKVSFLSGTVATTERLGIGLRGQEGHLRLLGSLGVNRTWNADHMVGRRATTVVAQLEATLRLGRRG